jgi:hypothetical protein
MSISMTETLVSQSLISSILGKIPTENVSLSSNPT